MICRNEKIHAVEYTGYIHEKESLSDHIYITQMSNGSEPENPAITLILAHAS